MSLSFNRDLKLLVTANTDPHGYSVFRIDDSTCDKLHFHKGKRIYLIGWIVGLPVGYIVLEDSQSQLLMCNFEKDKIINRKLYAGEILAVKISPKHLVVLLHDRICIHNNIDDLTDSRYEDVPRNLYGICALAEEASYFAYPWNRSPKHELVLNSVQIIDISKKPKVITMTIYPTELLNIAAISLNKTGKLVAITNTDGKLIRVYEVESGNMIIEFLRRLTRVSIDSLWFSACEKYLVSSSNNKMVHIFEINQQVEASPAQRIVKFLPLEVQERAAKMLVQKSSYATAYLEREEEGTGCIFEITTVGNQKRLLVATPSGSLHVYIIPKDKGTCEYHSTFNLRYNSRKRPMVSTFPSREPMQIDEGNDEPTESRGLMAKAAASVSKLAARVSTSSGCASTSAAGDSTLTAGASISAAGGSTSTSGGSTSTSGSLTLTGGASTSAVGASNSDAGASILSAVALSLVEGASNSAAAVMTDASSDEEDDTQ